MALTQVQSGMMNSDSQNYGFKNRIINGAMVIDQRNAGASVTPTDAQFTLDRWRFFLSQASKLTMQQNQGSVTPPAGFSKYLGITSSSAYTVGTSERFSLMTSFESCNVYDFAWGTANASPVTLSFWVRSSLTGTFGGAVRNWAYTYSYPFTYTINAANTWEYKTVTIPGPTSGTWVMDGGNGGSIELLFNLGAGSTYSGTAGSWATANYTSATGATSLVGTNGATLQITGVQLEKGSTATQFDYRAYGTELSLCQRYAIIYGATTVGNYQRVGTGVGVGATVSRCVITLPAGMRTTPTMAFTGSPRVENGSAAGNWSSVASVSGGKSATVGADITCSSSFTAAQYGCVVDTGPDGVITISAEL